MSGHALPLCPGMSWVGLFSPSKLPLHVWDLDPNLIHASWIHLANTTEPSVCGGDAALCQISRLRLGMARVNKGLQVLPATHTFNSQLKKVIPAFTTRPQSVTALWPVLISHPTKDRKLSWPGWLVTYQDAIPANCHPSQY